MKGKYAPQINGATQIFPHKIREQCRFGYAKSQGHSFIEQNHLYFTIMTTFKIFFCGTVHLTRNLFSSSYIYHKTLDKYLRLQKWPDMRKEQISWGVVVWGGGANLRGAVLP